MFGRAPRGVSERPKTILATKTIPSWLWLVVLVLAGICVMIFLSLWSPWKPVDKSVHPIANNTVTTDEDTNKDYKFYDLLPRQQVTPIPEQAVPEHQSKQPVIVIEAKNSAAENTNTTIDDPLDGAVTKANISSSPRYILQIRSYEDPDSADIRRAEIVRNGLSAEVIITNEGHQVWYRVISGPYDTQDAAGIAQQTLQNSGIDSIIVKQSTH